MTGWFSLNGYRARKVLGPDGRSRTSLEHREVMAAIVGRPLASDEHVHHRDGDRSNNAPGNLELLSRSEHARRHRLGIGDLHLICSLCGVAFVRRGNNERGNRKRGKRGPFCGKSCAGKWSRAQQLARAAE